MGRAWKKRRETHRRPPRPETWNIERGNCRFCGGPIIENGVVNRRKHWHQPCADLWQLMNNPAKMRVHVFYRDHGVCQNPKCGYTSRDMRHFHADHIKPLFESYGDLSYYEPENVMLLCIPCHRDKTKVEMVLYRQLQEIEYPEVK